MSTARGKVKSTKSELKAWAADFFSTHRTASIHYNSAKCLLAVTHFEVSGPPVHISPSATVQKDCVVSVGGWPRSAAHKEFSWRKTTAAFHFFASMFHTSRFPNKLPISSGSVFHVRWGSEPCRPPHTGRRRTEGWWLSDPFILSLPLSVQPKSAIPWAAKFLSFLPESAFFSAPFLSSVSLFMHYTQLSSSPSISLEILHFFSTSLSEMHP